MVRTIVPACQWVPLLYHYDTVDIDIVEWVDISLTISARLIMQAQSARLTM